jgi:hypothetical protein
MYFIIKTRKIKHLKKPLPPILFPLIGLVLSVGFNMLLFNVVDPGAQDTIKEITIKYMVTRWRNSMLLGS